MREKLFSKSSILLIVIGIFINIALVYLTGLTGLPLYVDAVGTVLAAVLGGVLPGITVGFFSNLINYLFAVSQDPLTLYYGIISVLLAVSTFWLAKKELFLKWKTTIAAVFVLAFVGGGLGSVLTWMLYGLNFGENISSGLVISLYEILNCPPFLAQLLGDYIIDLADKGIVVLLAYAVIRVFPQKLLESFPYGCKYQKGSAACNMAEDEEIHCRKKSLKVKLTVIVVMSALILSIASVGIGIYIHQAYCRDYYEEECIGMADTAAALVNGDRISQYRTQEESVGYQHLQNAFQAMAGNEAKVEVLQIFCREDGRYRSLFSGDESAAKQGEAAYIVWPKEAEEGILRLESGEASGTLCIRTNNKTSLLAVAPIKDSTGDITAYAAVQLGLEALNSDVSVYLIKVFSLLFGIGIILVGYIFWFYEHSILEPIKILILQTKEAARKKPEGQRLRDRMKVETGDELEILFQDMCEAEDAILQSDNASRSKTEFLSKLSHEIRTPLNSVIGFSQLALNGRKEISKEDLLDYMHKIQISGTYLLELVSDVLDISRIEEGRMTVNNEACRLDELIEEIVDSFQGQMKRKNLEFVIDKQYEDPLLYMDSFHTIQILNNLISNAYKYTEEGGVVGFEIHAREIDRKHMRVTYIVQDTGIGMSEEFQKKIFEPFTQDERGMKMKKQLRGSGLGMSICKKIVDLLGGTIKLESAEGEGTCFTVTIDYELISRSKSAAGNDNSQDYTALQGRKILVVDDVEMNRIVVEKLLESYGLKFEDAEDGRQAIARYEASAPGEYFCIFMDVQMPEMNGYEATQVIRNMKRADKDIPIVGMTADAFSDDVKKAKDSGMNYHVTKPIQVKKVLAVLMDLLRNEPQ